LAGLAAAALLFAACSSSGSSPAPGASVATSASAGAPSVVAGPPPAPTNFTATRKNGSVPCPSADGSCSQTDLAWQSTAGAGTWFKIYWSGTGEDPAATCLTVQSEAVSKLNSMPDAKSAQVFDPMAVGGGQTCWWITAVNGAGESAQVAAAGNSPSAVAPSAAAAAPPAPTSFTAARKTGVTCPSADPNGDHCYQDDFAWQASSDPEKGFRVYEASFGFDPNGTCAGVQADAKAILDTKPGARSAQLFAPMAVGGGQPCYWITAVNSAGESEQVPAAGN
jgi:hypothetical protein